MVHTDVPAQIAEGAERQEVVQPGASQIRVQSTQKQKKYDLGKTYQAVAWQTGRFVGWLAGWRLLVVVYWLLA